MKIAYLHNIEIEIDARTQKEINSLISNGHSVLFCGWNKEKRDVNEKKKIIVREKEILIENICEKVRKSKGLKENIVPLIRYEFKLLIWLVKHQKEYEAIHGCSLDILILAYPIAKMFRKKIVYDIYDDYADSHVVGKKLYSIIKKVDKYLIEHVDTLIICSEKRMEQIASNKAKKIVVIHNTPDIKEIGNDYIELEKNNRMKVVYVGNLHEGRYTYELAEIISQNPLWEFHCGGSGALEQKIKMLANTYNNIFFYGKLPYEKTLALEKECDVITALYDPNFPNHKYAAPNKFYEALYLGKPTVMAHETGMDEYVDKYRLGITTEFSKEGIEYALNKISEDLQVWRGRSEDIRSMYFNYFSWEIMEERLLEIYR